MTIKALDGLMPATTDSEEAQPEAHQSGEHRLRFLEARLQRIVSGETLVVGWVSVSEAREILTLLEDRRTVLSAIANEERTSQWIDKRLAQQLLAPASLLALVNSK